MSAEHDRSHRERRRGDDDAPGPRSTDLLDLVRSAEEDARLALRKRTPAIATAVAMPAPSEDFIDVGDEATEAPPSVPGGELAAAEAIATARRATARPRAVAAPPAARTMTPALAIALVFAVAIAALALLAR